MENNVMDKVLAITNKGLQERIERETREAHERAERDREIVEKAIALIHQNLMYKDAGHGSYHHYVLATEEMFFQDFMKKAEYEWRRGIKFADDGEKAHLRGSFVVNGERYYDMRYLLDKYTRDIERRQQEICAYNDRLHDLRRSYDDLIRQRPAIERMIKEWTAAQEEVTACLDDSESPAITGQRQC